MLDGEPGPTALAQKAQVFSTWNQCKTLLLALTPATNQLVRLIPPKFTSCYAVRHLKHQTSMTEGFFFSTLDIKKKGLKENRRKSLARLLHPVPMMVSCIDLLSRKLPNDHIYISALLRRWFVCGKTLMFFETTLIVVAVSFIWPSGSELPEYGSFPRGTNYLY